MTGVFIYKVMIEEVELFGMTLVHVYYYIIVSLATFTFGSSVLQSA